MTDIKIRGTVNRTIHLWIISTVGEIKSRKLNNKNNNIRIFIFLTSALYCTISMPINVAIYRSKLPIYIFASVLSKYAQTAGSGGLKILVK